MAINVPGGVRVRHIKSLQETEASLGSTLYATAEETVHHNPTNAIGNLIELNTAQYGEVDFGLTDAINPFYEPKRNTPDSPTLEAEDARARVAEEGLKLTIPDEGIPERALDILMSRKREENRRASVLARSPDGFVAGSAKLGVSIGGSLMDPLNIAASFIPVVGQAKYAGLLAKSSGAFGRAGVRASVGVAEGAVGAALLEPIVYASAAREQADYDMYDSLTNVAFGSIMGGGLHVGGGAIKDAFAWRSTKAEVATTGDALSKAAPKTREAMLRASVAQSLEGRVVNIRSVAELDPALRFREDQFQASTALSSGTLDIKSGPIRFAAEGAEIRLDQVSRTAREIEPEAFRLAEEIEPRIAEIKVRAEEAVSEAETKAKADILKASDEVSKLDARIKAAETGEQIKALESQKNAIIKANGGETFKAKVTAAKSAATKAKTKSDNLDIERGFLEQELSKLEPRIDRATNAAIQRATPKAETSQRFKQVHADAVQNSAPESIRLANFLASEEASEALKHIPDTQSFKEAQIELDGATEQVVSLAEKLGLDEALDELAEFDDLIDSSQAQARAVRAAALCDLRR